MFVHAAAVYKRVSWGLFSFCAGCTEGADGNADIVKVFIQRTVTIPTTSLVKSVCRFLRDLWAIHLVENLIIMIFIIHNI